MNITGISLSTHVDADLLLTLYCFYGKFYFVRGLTMDLNLKGFEFLLQQLPWQDIPGNLDLYPADY